MAGNGKLFGFGESEFPELNSVKGRIAGLLPTKVPDAAMRDLAKTMLQIKSAAPPRPAWLRTCHGHGDGDQVRRAVVATSASRA